MPSDSPQAQPPTDPPTTDTPARKTPEQVAEQARAHAPVSWIPGPPDKEGTFWVVWEDGSGFQSVYLIVVENKLPHRAALPPSPQILDFPDVSSYLAAQNTFAQKHKQLHYACPSSGDSPGEWIPLTELHKERRVTHHARIPVPSNLPAWVDPTRT